MIISRTPFRISFFGGGTDFTPWYQQHGGAVLSVGAASSVQGAGRRAGAAQARNLQGPLCADAHRWPARPVAGVAGLPRQSHRVHF